MTELARAMYWVWLGQEWERIYDETEQSVIVFDITNETDDE